MDSSMDSAVDSAVDFDPAPMDSPEISNVADDKPLPDWSEIFGAKDKSAETTQSTDTDKATDKAPEAAPEVTLESLQAELEKYRAFDPLLNELRSKGVESDAALRERLAAEQVAAETQQVLATAQLQTEQEIAADIQARIDAGLLPFDKAEQEFDRMVELAKRESDINQRFEAMENLNKQTQVIQALESFPSLKASGEEGSTLVAALADIAQSAGGDYNPRAVAQFVDNLLTKHAQSAIAAYEAKRTASAKEPATMRGANGSAPAPLGGAKDVSNYSWSDIFGISGRRV